MDIEFRDSDRCDGGGLPGEKAESGGVQQPMICSGY